ncbi:unnamed protein product [Peronospora belbahrii]|uniref:Phosphate acetyl/butaryl transferase domain-containing protein n=1 Tax=Peronospora belbahrii TaxID=622444 RepID=A0AAU9KMU0_9STRA|nr:unnamed protein product [Peronospora belbahrii]
MRTTSTPSLRISVYGMSHYEDDIYFETVMVEMGDADGMVSGACHTTANTIRPALQLIKTMPNRPIVSSILFMCLEDGVRIYGDCAVNTDPNAQDLAQIAVTSAESADAFGLIPKVALLSYATGDSNSGPDKVRKATEVAKSRPGHLRSNSVRCCCGRVNCKDEAEGDS